MLPGHRPPDSVSPVVHEPSSADPAARRTLTARTAVVTASGQMASRALALALTVASTAVVVRAIGEDGFATWGTVLMLFAMFAFALDPGVAPVVVRRLSQDPDQAPSPSALLSARLALAVAAYIAVVAVSLALRGDAALAVALVLAAQLLPRAVVMNVGTWMQAEHRLHVQTSLEAATVGGGLLLLIPLAAMDAPAWVLAAAGVLLPAIVLAWLMQRQLHKLAAVPPRGRGVDRGLVRSVLREAAPLAGAIVLVSIYTRIGVVFVNEAQGGDVADFTFAFLFIEQVIVVAAIVAATLLPMLAARASTRSPPEDPVVHDLLEAVSVLGAVGAIALVALARPLVLLIGGGELEGATELLRLLAPTCVALFANLYVAYLFVATGRARLYLIYNLVGLAVSLLLGFTLTLEHGAEAAARVTWITELTVVCLAAVPFFGREGGGRRALAWVVVTMAVAVACSELVTAGTLSPVPAALAAAGLLALMSFSRARRWRDYLRAARTPATGAVSR